MVMVFLTYVVASSLSCNNNKRFTEKFSVNRLLSEATMGFEPMMRVLQFCTVGSANENYLQAAANPSLECSCTVSACEKLEKSSKNGLP